MHEGGWSIRGRPDGDMTFIRPDGFEHVPIRPRLRDDIRERILGPRRPVAKGSVLSALDLCNWAARTSTPETVGT
ncbi:MAG: hypothetical protein ACRDJL_05205 [Actinomycetota bacterium]